VIVSEQDKRDVISVLSIVPPPHKQEFTVKPNFSQDNQMVVFRCGIIDKTEMYEAARQKCSRDCFFMGIVCRQKIGKLS